jgi:hypothetical protein
VRLLSLNHRARRFAGFAAGAVVVGALFAGPAVASPPDRVIFKLDGLSAATTFVHWERAGELDRAVVTSVHFGRHRNNYYAEPPERRELVSINVSTYWLPVDRESDDEVVAVIEETGLVETSGVIDIDALRLASANLAPTDVTLGLLYCSPMPGWEELCDDLPAERTVAVAAELGGIGELARDRYRSHEDVFVCDILEVGSHSSRDAEGTVWIDGTAHSRLIPWSTYISDGTTIVRLLCQTQ